MPANRSLAEATSAASIDKIAEDQKGVKRKYSYVAATDKQDAINDLKGIFAAVGGDPAEQRRYVAQMEQSDRNSERNSSQTGENSFEAKQILHSAEK